MLRRVMPILTALFLLALPFCAFALEQSFTQGDLKAVIRLTPDVLVVGKKIDLAIKLEQDGKSAKDRSVTLEVYGKGAVEPTIRREVDLLDDEYLDSWSFERPGDYRVVLSIADPRTPGEALHYEVKASVGEANSARHDGHEEHGFFSHHFGGKWGWVMGGMMLIMVPLMIIGL